MKEDLLYCVPAHIGYGPGEKMRVPIVHGLIEKLASLRSEEKKLPKQVVTSEGSNNEKAQ